MQTSTGSFVSLELGAGSTETGNNGSTNRKREAQGKPEPEISGRRRTTA